MGSFWEGKWEIRNLRDKWGRGWGGRYPRYPPGGARSPLRSGGAWGARTELLRTRLINTWEIPSSAEQRKPSVCLKSFQCSHFPLLSGHPPSPIVSPRNPFPSRYYSLFCLLVPGLSSRPTPSLPSCSEFSSSHSITYVSQAQTETQKAGG